MPALCFYDFGSGSPVAKEAAVSVIEDGAQTAKTITGRSYKVEAQERAQIIYSTTDKNDKAVYEVPVVDVGFGVRLGLSMDKYFYSSDIDVEKLPNYLVFKANKRGDVKTEFINRLYAQEVTVSFSLIKELEGYKAINFYLTDSIDESITVKLSYRREDNRVLFSVNDGKESVVDSNASGDCNLRFDFDYENNFISQLSGVQTHIPATLKGDKFTGFTSKYVYLSMEIEGADTGAGFRFYKINNQLFCDKKLDGIEPRIYAENIRGYRVIGSEVTIKASAAIDILCPTVTYSMRVTDAEGKVVSDTAGNILNESADTGIDHTIRLEKMGKYTISFVATDASDNMTPYTFIVTVTDITPPALTLKDISSNAKVGSTVKLASVSYDAQDVTSIYVVVMCPDSSMVFVEDGSIKVTMAGTYYVNYYATDANGNVTFEGYAIKVS